MSPDTDAKPDGLREAIVCRFCLRPMKSRNEKALLRRLSVHLRNCSNAARAALEMRVQVEPTP